MAYSTFAFEMLQKNDAYNAMICTFLRRKDCSNVDFVISMRQQIVPTLPYHYYGDW